MAGQKRKTVAGEETAPRRRSQRINSAAQKQQEEEDAKTSDTKAHPAKKPKVNTTNPTTATTGKQKKELTKDEDEDVPAEPDSKDAPTTEETLRLQPETLEFLRQLGIYENNHRPWLQEHDAEYRAALKDWERYIATLARKVRAVDPTIPDLPVKNIIWRIQRDVRFASDGFIYKTFFAATFSRSGRASSDAAYILHCEPGGKSFIRGGLECSKRIMDKSDGAFKTNEAIDLIREDIDNHPETWRKVLADKGLWKSFLSKVEVPAAAESSGDGVKKETKSKAAPNKAKSKPGAEEDQVDPEKAIAAFAHLNRATALARRPQGCPPNHPDLALLRLKDFFITAPLDDSIFLDPKGQDVIIEMVKNLTGFVSPIAYRLPFH
jgi:uncharacterized protein (TIGR02453 family)